MKNMKQENLLLFILVVCLNPTFATVFDNSINEETLPVCKDLIKEASLRHVRAPVPLLFDDLEGTWVSKSCETRPGLEYVKRSYWFSSEGKMLLQLRFYEDKSCRVPRLMITAKGLIKLERKSYVTPGGTEADYSFDRITIKTYSAKSSKRIIKKMSKFRYCKVASILKKLKPGKEVILYQAAGNTNQTSEMTYNCAEFLSWNELQLIRIEEDLQTKKSSDGRLCSRKEMFLGDLHTDIRYQKEYRPTAYQTPLVQDGCVSDCNGCTTKTDSYLTKFKPEFERKVPLVTQGIIGYWASVRCEVQRYGLFLTRMLHFSSMTSSWNLKQHYYYDPTCLKPMYTILAGGSVQEVNNTNIPKEIDMKISRMSIIPQDKKFAAQLNRLPRGLCGKGSKWTVGGRKDITVTGGCTPIGLLVPSKEPEIVKIEIDEHFNQQLYLGQTPTWPRKRNRVVSRPTSWGPGLSKCQRYSHPVEDNRISPMANARTALEDNAGIKIDISTGLNIIMFILCYILYT